MIELIAVATITVLAVLSPGADFAMVTRHSLLHGRAAGLMASLGIALGVQLHVLYTMLGVGLLIKSTPQLFTVIKLAGAVYLIYVGCKTFTTRARLDSRLEQSNALMPFGALRSGFLTNALNPKTTLFVVSIYTQVIQPSTPLALQIGYGLFMSAAHGLWFSIVSIFFSNERLRAKMLERQVALNRVIGTILAALGVSLALASAAWR